MPQKDNVGLIDIAACLLHTVIQRALCVTAVLMNQYVYIWLKHTISEIWATLS